MKKLYAVVVTATNKVIGKAMFDPYQKTKMVDLSLRVMNGDEYIQHYTVHLSDSQGNIKLTDELPDSPNYYCIDGSNYGCDLWMTLEEMAGLGCANEQN